MSCKTTQKGSSVSSGIKLVIRSNTLLKTLKKNQAEILELKNSINEIKNALESPGNVSDHMEERSSEFKDRNL